MKLTLLLGKSSEIYELELSVNLNLNGRKSTFTTKMSGRRLAKSIKIRQSFDIFSFAEAYILNFYFIMYRAIQSKFSHYLS